ncbi:hypothetical protein FN846DRAFT_951720 [Sphaerosporella brunnea]|uniref:Uncharacterized protein n=1 Tax=Sphaerosporella brunnea TaxID=1250544 RepID=A0A5J5EUZ4_9PEZI|nr:hypothetical protein FN846DRAFT_951720 [Sphaerosporella brunnea]
MASSNAITPPQIRLHEPAVDFIDNHGSEYHPGLARSSTHYDPLLQKYTGDPQATHRAPSPTKEHADLDSLFAKALQRFRTTTEEPKRYAKAPFKIRDKRSWDEVEKEVSAARAQYMNLTGRSGEIRKWLRKVGDHGSAAKPYVNFIPNGTYTSILSAGANILIDAAIRTSKFRGNLEQLIIDLPNKLQDIGDYLQIYPTEEKIHQATIQLYVAILVALEEVVRYYIEKPVKHAKSVFLGDEYERSLGEKLGEIDKAATYLLRQADICHQKSSKRDSQIHSQQMEQVQQTLEFQNSILLVLRDNPQNLEWLNDIDAERNRLKRKASARKLEIQRLTMQKAILEAKLHEVQLQSRTPSPQPTYISQLKLLELLATDPNIASADREACVHAGQAFKMATQDRAGWLMQSEKLKSWLTSRYAEVRLIHGNHEPLKISPVSYLCAMLVESLEKLKPALVLYFFCGSHTQSRDPLSNAYALLKSLLAQLLSQHTFDTSFLQPYDVQRLEKNDLQSLCNLFWGLAQQLDSTVALFCIIDGISFFETSQREPAMHAVLDKLLALARGDTMGTVFKLLVTSPATTKPKLCRKFAHKDVITVPPAVPRSGIGFDGKQMAAKAERYIVVETETAYGNDHDQEGSEFELGGSQRE